MSQICSSFLAWQSNNQSINQSINRSINQSIKSKYRLIDKPKVQIVNRVRYKEVENSHKSKCLTPTYKKRVILLMLLMLLEPQTYYTGYKGILVFLYCKFGFNILIWEISPGLLITNCYISCRKCNMWIEFLTLNTK